MRVKEAKDFLVQEIVTEARLKATPLSDLERRMLYFTESADASEDPIALNDEFEAQYDTADYERRISRLMSHAYRRIKRESPEKLREWNEAIRILQRGDHYILVFWHQPKSRDFFLGWRLKALAIVGVIGLYSLFLFLFGSKANLRRGEPAPIEKYIPALSPTIQHMLQFLFLVAIVSALFPKLFSELANVCWPYLRSRSRNRK